MRNKSEHIPVYTLPTGANGGIMIMRKSFDGSPNSAEIERPHRDHGYTFIVQEKGSTQLEIDFQTFCLASPAVIFIRPGQVHRVIAFESATISTWMITEENLRPEYLDILNNLAPVNPLTLTATSASVLSEAALICLKLFERNKEKLYKHVLNDSCNLLVGLVVSQYMANIQTSGNHSRNEVVTKAFNQALEKNFRTMKRPAAYADSLNISTPYLNQCINATSGQSVSYHIKERVILEAKRLLYHSTKSVKEIAAELGYDDYSYFTRLFVKTVGITPLTFRNTNRD